MSSESLFLGTPARLDRQGRQGVRIAKGIKMGK